MATVLTCHVIETVWARSHKGVHAPFMVLDHNGTQQQTEVMGAGAVTVCNAKASFTYAPYSDLVIMAFDAAGRQPGAYLAQAVVDVATLLQGGRLNASAQLVSRKGRSVGLVLFDVEISTSSSSLAAGLNIPALTLQHASSRPDSPRTKQERYTSPEGGGSAGRRSPFAQPAAQQPLEQQATHTDDAATPRSPSSPASVGQRLVDSFTQAFGGAIRMRRGSPRRNANVAGSSTSSGRLRASAPWGGSLELTDGSGQVCGDGSGSPLSDHRARFGGGGVSPSTARSMSLPAAPGYAPPWGSAAAAGGGGYSSAEWAGSPVRHGGSRSSSPHGAGSRMEALRPQQLAVPPPAPTAAHGQAGHQTTASPGSPQLSPLMGAHARLRLQRRQPLPPPALPPYLQPHGSGLIPVGREPGTPDSCMMMALGRSGPLLMPQHYLTRPQESLVPASAATAASVDYAQLLREFEAADAAGKEALLYRELVEQQQQQQQQQQQYEPNRLRRLLSTHHLQQQQQQEHDQAMITNGSVMDQPISSPVHAAEAAGVQTRSSSEGGACSSMRRTSSSSGGERRQSCSFATMLSPLSKAVATSVSSGIDPAAAVVLPPPAGLRAEVSDAAVQTVVQAAPAERATAAVQVEPQSPAWLRASCEASEALAYSDDECMRVHQVRCRMRQQQQYQQQKLQRKYAERAPSPASVAAAAARMLNNQLLRRLNEREAAEAAAAEQALLSCCSGSDAGSDAGQLHDAPAAYAAATAAAAAAAAVAQEAEVLPMVPAAAATTAGAAARNAKPSFRDPGAHAVRPKALVSPVQPSPSERGSAGRLESISSYLLRSSSSFGGGSSSHRYSGGGASPKERWLPPARDIVLPYPAPLPAFPALAVGQQATAPFDDDDNGAEA